MRTQLKGLHPMTNPAQSGSNEQSGTEDDSTAQRAQAASDPGSNHDVGTDGDEQSVADREDGQ
jgi:hypothetical protein